jgi:hypothetical protein
MDHSDKIHAQVYQISDASLLRKSSCNYLRSAVSCEGSLALIVAGGIRIFTYSDISGNVIDTFCTIRLPVTEVIRDVAWAPRGWDEEEDGLAICFEDRLEVWIKPFSEKGKAMTLHKAYQFGKKITGILHIIWDTSFLKHVYVCSSTRIHKVQLSPSSKESEGNETTQLLPSLNTRHPGGLALSAAGTFITGNAYREAVGAFGFTGGDDSVGRARGAGAGAGEGDSSRQQSRRRLVLERCGPPPLSPEEAQKCDEIRYHSSGAVSCCSDLCILSFAPEARISTPAPAGTLAPSSAGRAVLLGGGSSGSASSPLISVVSSTPLISVVNDEGGDDAIESTSLSSLQATESRKPRGAFPHSTFSTSIAETLSIGSRDHSGSGDVEPVTNALEALQSLSTCNISIGDETEGAASLERSARDSEAAVNLMATGLLCAVRTRKGARLEVPGAGEKEKEKEEEDEDEDEGGAEGRGIEWLGSALSLAAGAAVGTPGGGSSESSSGSGSGSESSSSGSGSGGPILRPDVLALHPLPPPSPDTGLPCASHLLAVSSTLSGQMIVYHMHSEKVFLLSCDVLKLYISNLTYLYYLGENKSSI